MTVQGGSSTVFTFWRRSVRYIEATVCHRTIRCEGDECVIVVDEHGVGYGAATQCGCCAGVIWRTCPVRNLLKMRQFKYNSNWANQHFRCHLNSKITRKSSCVNAKGIPPVPHNRPGPVWWEWEGEGGVSLSWSVLARGIGGRGIPVLVWGMGGEGRGGRDIPVLTSWYSCPV